MIFKKSLLVFIYLFTSCVFALNVFVVLLFIMARLFFFVMYDVPFEISISDLTKYIKAASFAGSLISVGCWWVYYQHYRKNRN
ncbi:hypothetical protein D6029_02215 [Buttiauxella izardii]|uniref:Uncharacterized protein n=1 Tax=Buttiauxella izardii TaxID=82991 RepID=A0A3A5JYT6_9ENTR|nr:hypothetical protein D6029_02215 [Buttiauxella izardii]